MMQILGAGGGTWQNHYHRPPRYQHASQYADANCLPLKDGQVFCKGTTAQIMQADLLSQLYEIPITLANNQWQKDLYL